MTLCNCELTRLFTNSIWIVPTETLLAYHTIGTKNSPVSDQTVWLITSYTNGYIFGTSYTAIDTVPTAKTDIIGSMSPYGDVLLSFYSNNNVTTGSGKFMKINNKWQFIMQMNSLTTLSGETIGLSHWSFMKNITKDDKEYYDLPGIGISVPKFIELFK
jgi:hypothetical protein